MNSGVSKFKELGATVFCDFEEKQMHFANAPVAFNLGCAFSFTNNVFGQVTNAGRLNLRAARSERMFVKSFLQFFVHLL